jgi:hypothetical protein
LPCPRPRSFGVRSSLSSQSCSSPRGRRRNGWRASLATSRNSRDRVAAAARHRAGRRRDAKKAAA